MIDVASDGEFLPRKMEAPFLNNCAGFMEVATNEKLVHIVKRLLGCSRPRLILEQCFLKPPKCGSFKPAHQDNYYFELQPRNSVLTAWIAME